jgi:AraC-like DNA-binding protein
MPKPDKTLSENDILRVESADMKELNPSFQGKAAVELVECDIRSPRSQTLAVGSGHTDSRLWLQSSPKCDLLKQHHMLHLGVATMPAPFRIVRTKLSGTYFLATLSGQGRVLVEGRWEVSRPGHAFLLPPKTLHAFYTPGDHEWKFCWVRYQEARGQLPIARANSPVLAKYDAGPLEMAILGLRNECLGDNAPLMHEHWLRLIHLYVQKFSQPNNVDQRLRDTWDHVVLNLADPWTITDLAKMSHISEKQFQRLCRRDLGRSPQQHLMWLRMRRAAELLANQRMKIQSIAEAVGYQNPFVFSSTFKRIMGWAPSHFPVPTSGSSKAAETQASAIPDFDH